MTQTQPRPSAPRPVTASATTDPTATETEEQGFTPTEQNELRALLAEAIGQIKPPEISLELMGPTGHRITVACRDTSDMFRQMKRFGAQGYGPAELPAGGLSFPLAAFEDFNWAIIGAELYPTDKDEYAVNFRGVTFKIRELEEVDTKKIKLPKIVKASRGARPTDPPHLKEGEEGGVQYVTLASFRGKGMITGAMKNYLLNADEKAAQHDRIEKQRARMAARAN